MLTSPGVLKLVLLDDEDDTVLLVDDTAVDDELLMDAALLEVLDVELLDELATLARLPALDMFMALDDVLVCVLPFTSVTPK